MLEFVVWCNVTRGLVLPYLGTNVIWQLLIGNFYDSEVVLKIWGLAISLSQFSCLTMISSSILALLHLFYEFKKIVHFYIASVCSLGKSLLLAGPLLVIFSHQDFTQQ